MARQNSDDTQTPPVTSPTSRSRALKIIDPSTNEPIKVDPPLSSSSRSSGPSPSSQGHPVLTAAPDPTGVSLKDAFMAAQGQHHSSIAQQFVHQGMIPQQLPPGTQILPNYTMQMPMYTPQQRHPARVHPHQPNQHPTLHHPQHQNNPRFPQFPQQPRSGVHPQYMRPLSAVPHPQHRQHSYENASSPSLQQHPQQVVLGFPQHPQHQFARQGQVVHPASQQPKVGSSMQLPVDNFASPPFSSNTSRGPQQVSDISQRISSRIPASNPPHSRATHIPQRPKSAPFPTQPSSAVPANGLPQNRTYLVPIPPQSQFPKNPQSHPAIGNIITHNSSGSVVHSTVQKDSAPVERIDYVRYWAIEIHKLVDVVQKPSAVLLVSRLRDIVGQMKRWFAACSYDVQKVLDTCRRIMGSIGYNWDSDQLVRWIVIEDFIRALYQIESYFRSLLESAGPEHGFESLSSSGIQSMITTTSVPVQTSVSQSSNSNLNVRANLSPNQSVPAASVPSISPQSIQTSRSSNDGRSEFSQSTVGDRKKRSHLSKDRVIPHVSSQNHYVVHDSRVNNAYGLNNRQEKSRIRDRHFKKVPIGSDQQFSKSKQSLSDRNQSQRPSHNGFSRSNHSPYPDIHPHDNSTKSKSSSSSINQGWGFTQSPWNSKNPSRTSSSSVRGGRGGYYSSHRGGRGGRGRSARGRSRGRGTTTRGWKRKQRSPRPAVSLHVADTDLQQDLQQDLPTSSSSPLSRSHLINDNLMSSPDGSSEQDISRIASILTESRTIRLADESIES